MTPKYLEDLANAGQPRETAATLVACEEMMATPEQIAAARATLEARWDSEGDCGSCGWHAALYEHRVSDVMLAGALDNENGLLRLACQSDDRDDADMHRGVRIRVA